MWQLVPWRLYFTKWMMWQLISWRLYFAKGDDLATHVSQHLHFVEADDLASYLATSLFREKLMTWHLSRGTFVLRKIMKWLLFFLRIYKLTFFLFVFLILIKRWILSF